MGSGASTLATKTLIGVNELKLMFDGESAHAYLSKSDRCVKFWTAVCQRVLSGMKASSSLQVKHFRAKELLPVDICYFKDQDIAVRFTDLDEDLGDLDASNDKDGGGGLIGLSEASVFLAANKYELGDDTQFFFPTNEEGRKVGHDLFDAVYPKSEYAFEELHSNHALTLICYYGVGQHYLTGVRSASQHNVENADCEVDLSFLFPYKTRANYERYGAIAYFDKDKEVIAIYWSLQNRVVYPSEADWEHVKYVFRSSLLTAITGRDHLVFVHWIVSNNAVFATRQSFRPDHPIRRLLKQHLFNTVQVNWSAKNVLQPTNGLAARLFAFDGENWNKILSDCLKTIKYETFDDFINKKGLPEHVAKDLPLSVDGKALWNVIYKYVSTYLSLWYPDDASVLADSDITVYWAHYGPLPFWTSFDLPPLNRENLFQQITHTIFWVTGGHELVGSIGPYANDPNGVGCKIIPDKNEADVDSFLLAKCLISMTSLKKPMLMNDWTHVHVHPGLNQQQVDHVKQTLIKFQDDLAILSQRIDELNQHREHKFVSFNPRVLEVSVSV